MVKHVLYT